MPKAKAKAALNGFKYQTNGLAAKIKLELTEAEPKGTPSIINPPYSNRTNKSMNFK